jgi:hypothetical protein
MRKALFEIDENAIRLVAMENGVLNPDIDETAKSLNSDWMDFVKEHIISKDGKP